MRNVLATALTSMSKLPGQSFNAIDRHVEMLKNS